MHPWHDYPIDEASVAQWFPAIVEVPMGSKNKYELDKVSGLLRLDRVLYSAVVYPANYGFVPRTYCDDGDPLDVLVFGQEAVLPLTVVDVRAIGVMQMRDEKGIDDKLLAVAIGDPAFADHRDEHEHDRSGRERDRIERRHAEQRALHQPRRCRCGGQPDRKADQRHAEPLTNDEPNQIAPFGPERGAHAELASPLQHAVRQ